ncbi:MAG: hypothetical protein JO267_01535 [Alphaproteobacteria bacterium]|nr:hypothetical protein [Alphaproteobacteria bacterium]
MRLLIAGLIVLSTPLAARAQQAPERVGRVSWAAGAVAVRSPDGDWRPAVENYPVGPGMSVRTAAQGGAELRLGPMTLALSNATRLEVTSLDAAAAQFTLPEGRVGIDLRRLDDAAGVAIALPHGRVSLLQPGQYDISAGTAQEPARVAVFTGSARFAGSALDITIDQGKTAMLSGADPVTAVVEPAAADSFVEWCRSRDVDETQLAAPFHLSREMTGYEVLDAHGSWDSTTEYGVAWFPNDVPADWTPYRDGHWTWIAPWGWSWIADQPWGFAPAHFGRWARIGERWGWVPGSFVAHPAYAPAMVVFLGTPGIGLSVAEGPGPAVAWFALAPGEVYLPGYTHDLDAIRRLNSGPVADPQAIEIGADGQIPAAVLNGGFANRRYAIAVPRGVFVAGKPVAPALLQLPEQRLMEAPLLMGSPQIAAPAPRSALLRRAPAEIPQLPAARPALAMRGPHSPKPRFGAGIGHPKFAAVAVARHRPYGSFSPVRRPRLLALPAMQRPHRPAAMLQPHIAAGRPHLASGRDGGVR